jgi:hypothetical protein
MNWTTLYISGRPGANVCMTSFLTESKFEFLAGTTDEEGMILFWVPDNFKVRKLKEAIGSKLLFKFRMRFFFSVDTFNTERSRNERRPYFTEDQERMFRDMN